MSGRESFGERASTKTVEDARADRPEPPMEAHDGFHYEAVEQDADWLTPNIGAGRCRYVVGHDRKACGRPAVATLMRGFGKNRQPWDYCGEHLYGRWIEDGKVMAWRLVPDDAAPRSGANRKDVDVR